MADGTVTSSDFRMKHYTPVDAVIAGTMGTWVSTQEYTKGIFHFLGIDTTTVFCQFDGHNQATIPTSASAGSILGSTITANGFYVVDPLPVWLKIRVITGTTTSAITAVGKLMREGGK